MCEGANERQSMVGIGKVSLVSMTKCRVIDYCVNKVRLLQVSGVTPIIVFDGARLPMKKRIETQRKKAREDSRMKAEEFLKAGEINKAIRKFMEAVEINSLMVYHLTQVLESMNIQFIVAPYESDAQLTYLFKAGKIDAVITEDSDLLAYGVTRVFFKMDKEGSGLEIDLSNLSQCGDTFKIPRSTEVISQRLLLQACILSGCDYCEGIKGIGFKKALKIVKEHRGDIKSILAQLERDNFKIRLNYVDEFERAELTFSHQVIYDLDLKLQRYLTPVDKKITDNIAIEYLGKIQPQFLAIEISRGRVDPDTLKSFEVILEEKKQ